MLARTARLLSSLTNQVALVQVPMRRPAGVRRVELVAVEVVREVARPAVHARHPRRPV